MRDSLGTRHALALASILLLLPIHSHGQSLLAIVKAGGAAEVRAALAQGSPICGRDEQGASPLLIAAACNPDPEVIEVLVAAGARLDERDQYDMTSLMRAAASNPNPEILGALIDAGACVNDQDQFGLTPLIYASGTNNQPEIVKLLISAGADVRCKDKFGMTAFDYLRQNVKLRTTAAYFYLRNAQ
jgi:ankyrin repeat protein